MSNVTTYIRCETVPQNRNRMVERSICNFRTRGERRATIRVIREEDRVERCEGNKTKERR